MGSFRSILQLSFITLSLAQHSGTSKLQWGPCNRTEVPGDIPVECSTLLVPLDYTLRNSSETLQLDLVKVIAPVKPSKGSILFNFGGPGGTARDEIGVTPIAQELLALTGRQYDLVAFDPRGTSGSKIPMKCYDNEYEAWSLFFDQKPSNGSDAELGNSWARGHMVSEQCLKTQKKTGSLISSAFTARDMMQVVDALGEDGLLRYWGFSYGTTLGATIAAMFPDRIDGMILDGVQNPHEYYHAQADFQEWTDSDKVFSSIFTGCVANRENCALATGNNKTADELEQAVWDLLDRVKYNPIALRNLKIDYTLLKSIIVNALYNSKQWPELALSLHYVLSDQLDLLQDLLDAVNATGITDIFAAIQQTQSLAGIHCGDNMVRTEKFEDFVPAVQYMYNTSRIIGDALVNLYSTCAQWKIEPKERYTGDFNVKTKNPVLFIGNSHDALTPLVSAKNVSATFEDSVVLEVIGYGHASLAAPSACTIRTTSAYWANGTLPPEGKVCELDAPLYSNVTWADVIDKVYGNGTFTSVKRDLSFRPTVGTALTPPSIWK
ncbi:alpha/beta-hydrolase [Annulohypoxylon maeteangense]|uniref:alpha/beta-hydrolase n=1 Tax=Annulohypoxylon maeteangense TaxID=1927788 RepID=UPI002008613A|nr:alpha/beta-hydrolase [Annulohypoxylon maeteangense]KAI0886788.1 alpha/beta-hydrolase [Annulohypoxylon maeteangense]